MPQVTCPNCKRTLNIPELKPGRRMRCPACKHVFAYDPSPPPIDAQPTYASVQWSNWFNKVGIGVFGIVAACVVIYLAVWLTSGPTALSSSTSGQSLAMSHALTTAPMAAAQQGGTSSTPTAQPARTTPQSVDASHTNKGTIQSKTSAALSVHSGKNVVSALQSQTPHNLAADALYAKVSPDVVLVKIMDRDFKPIALGTGFFISSNGTLVTNHHVIADAAYATVTLNNNATMPVKGIIADDPKTDLAILKVDGQNLPFLRINTDKHLKVGTTVYAIGNPEGLTNTLSKGLISGFRRQGDDVKFIQTTAAISHGSSGGPLLLANGSVIGVTSAFVVGGQNLNLAIPATAVQKLMASVDNLFAKKSAPMPLPNAPSAKAADANTSKPNIVFLTNEEIVSDILRNVTRIGVSVSLDDGAKAGGLNKHWLTTAVELRLRSSGIEVTDKALPYISVNVTTITLDRTAEVVYSIIVAYHTVLPEIQAQSRWGFVPIWSSGSFGITPERRLRAVIRSTIQDNLNDFINTCLEARQSTSP